MGGLRDHDATGRKLRLSRRYRHAFYARFAVGEPSPMH